MIGMGRAEAKSGQAAKRPMAATSGASLPRNVSVLSMVADLEGHDLNGLRRQWRAHLGGEAPAHLPRWLLMRVLAYQLQSDAFGDLDKTIRRNLRSEKDDGTGVRFDRRAPQTRQCVALKAGALLVREWRGRLERVMILEEGFGQVPFIPARAASKRRRHRRPTHPPRHNRPRARREISQRPPCPRASRCGGRGSA